MKGLILAGGRGTRLEDETKSQNKCLLRFEDKYVIQYSLDNALHSGVEEIVLVVGYQAERIINTISTSYKGVPIRYVIQTDQKGLVHAIECAREALEGSDFFLFLADEVTLNGRHKSMVEAFKDPEIFALCGVVNVEDTSRISKTYGLIFDNTSGQIYRLVEKPRRALNNTQGTGNCIFRNEIFEYIEVTPINQKRKEKELPDLIQCAIDDGKFVGAHVVASWYSNINTINELQESFPAEHPIQDC